MARPPGIEINHFGLEDFRIKEGLSQAKVAARSEISPGHYSDIEKGKTKPSLPTLHRIAKTLNIRHWSLRTDIHSRLGADSDEVAA